MEGATGDLTGRKFMPALCNLSHAGKMTPGCISQLIFPAETV